MIRIGPIGIEIEGDDKVAGIVRAELANRVMTSCGDELRFVIGQRVPQAAPSTFVRRLDDSRAPYRFRVSADGDHLELSMGLKSLPVWLYRVRMDSSWWSSGPSTVEVVLPSVAVLSALTMPFFKLLSRDGLSLREIMAKNVIYEIIDPLLWIRLTRCGATMLHASAVTVGERATVFSGSGGVGKSTALLSLMQAVPEAEYLGDDLVVIERGGFVVRHPKHLQVYEYNLQDSPETRQRVNQTMTATDRLLWRVKARTMGSSRVRRRSSANQLFGATRVADRSRLDTAIWVVPSASAQPNLSPLTQAEFARLATTAIVSEFWDFLRLINGAAIVDETAPSASAIAQISSDLLEEALDGVECRLLAVPPRYGGPRLASFLAVALSP